MLNLQVRTATQDDAHLIKSLRILSDLEHNTKAHHPLALKQLEFDITFNTKHTLPCVAGLINHCTFVAETNQYLSLNMPLITPAKQQLVGFIYMAQSKDDLKSLEIMNLYTRGGLHAPVGLTLMDQAICYAQKYKIKQLSLVSSENAQMWYENNFGFQKQLPKIFHTLKHTQFSAARDNILTKRESYLKMHSLAVGV